MKDQISGLLICGPSLLTFLIKSGIMPEVYS